MAWQSGAVERLRGLQSPDVLLRMLMLPVVRGYSLCKTVVPAKAGELDQHFRCRIAQTPAQERGGSGESLNRLPVGPYELIVADAGYCSAAGIEYVWQHGADALVRVNPRSFVAYPVHGRRIPLLPRLRALSKVGQWANGGVVMHGQGSAFAGRLCAVAKSDRAIQQAYRRLRRKASKKQMITGPKTLEFAVYVIVFTTHSSGSTADVLRLCRMRLAN
jgi:hypothetical protein